MFTNIHIGPGYGSPSVAPPDGAEQGTQHRRPPCGQPLDSGCPCHPVKSAPLWSKVLARWPGWLAALGIHKLTVNRHRGQPRRPESGGWGMSFSEREKARRCSERAICDDDLCPWVHELCTITCHGEWCQYLALPRFWVEMPQGSYCCDGLGKWGLLWKNLFKAPGTEHFLLHLSSEMLQSYLFLPVTLGNVCVVVRKSVEKCAESSM